MDTDGICLPLVDLSDVTSMCLLVVAFRFVLVILTALLINNISSVYLVYSSQTLRVNRCMLFNCVKDCVLKHCCVFCCSCTPYTPINGVLCNKVVIKHVTIVIMI